MDPRQEQIGPLLDELLRDDTDVPESLRVLYVRDRRGFQQVYLWAAQYLARLQRVRLDAERGGFGDAARDELEAEMRAEWHLDRAGFDERQGEVVLILLTAEACRQTDGKTDET